MKAYFGGGMGTLQHMLFVSGVQKDNTLFEEGENSLEARASQELRRALQNAPDNPWSRINKEDLFEYRLACLLQDHPDLKTKVMDTIDFFNSPWRFYREGLDFFNAAQEPRTRLGDTRFLLGENQVLAYFMSQQLYSLWTMSISPRAVAATHEIEGDEDGISVCRRLSRDCIRAAQDKKYGSGEEKYSFLDVWEELKKKLTSVKTPDFVQFSGHGRVISFDEELIVQQPHENPDLARALGFECWDSTYSRDVEPFCRRLGTAGDRVEFPQ